MRTSTMTSREFNQHVSRAKRAAIDGPVIITERGKPSYVLMRHEEFAKDSLTPNRPQNALEALTDPNASDIDVEFPRLPISFRDVDFS
jgi:PHD/YefM family antitoxin component YafN of YafNO toxin-antitoxin module